MPTLLLLAPVFLVFEVWQLAMSERYLGIKQIARGLDPREMGPGEGVSFVWATSIIAYGTWMIALLIEPAARAHALGLIGVTTIGMMVRRNCGLKWILIALTFEGAVRVGLLVSICMAAWRRFAA
jgi:hypothetical protein